MGGEAHAPLSAVPCGGGGQPLLPPRLSFLNARCQLGIFFFVFTFPNSENFKSFWYQELRMGKIVKFETKRDDAT